MTTSLRSTIHARLGWTWRDRAGTTEVVDNSRLETKINLADGAGASQADAVWHAEDATLADGQWVDLELNALEQILFGAPILIRLDRVKTLLIVNKSAGAPYLRVGAAAAGEWYEPFGAPGNAVKVMPGSPVLLANARDGWSVDAQHARLRLSAVGGTVTFDIAILGTLSDTYGSSSASSSI
jgi:hypothetical protein